MNDNNSDGSAAPAHTPPQHHNPIVSDHSIRSAPAPSSPYSPSKDELLSLKQDALKSLAPMVSHLDQSPEEKFKTLMMLIQASDNATLVKDAYAAAQQITDEKERAQALIDVVNEINYFTQQS